MKNIHFTAIVKDGGYEKLAITPKMFGELALAIQEKGFEYLQLKDRSLIIAGILLTTKDAGERVIVVGGLD